MQVENDAAEVSQLASTAEQVFTSANNSIREAIELQQEVIDREDELQNAATSIRNAVQNASQVDEGYTEKLLVYDMLTLW